MSGVQAAVQALTNQTWLLQPLAISVVSASSLTYAPPPPVTTAPPPPMTGKQITAVYRFTR